MHEKYLDFIKTIKMPPKTTKLDKAITLIVGEEVIPLINLIRGKSNVSEFKIADKLKLEINKTRNLLYKLNEKNLIEFTRKKDKQKGWYIYYWTFNEKTLDFALKKHLEQEVERLTNRLIREEDIIFFICDNKCVRVDFDKAMDFQFSCPECGELMHQQNNEKIKKELLNRLNKLKEELETITKIIEQKKRPIKKITKKPKVKSVKPIKSKKNLKRNKNKTNKTKTTIKSKQIKQTKQIKKTKTKSKKPIKIHKKTNKTKTTIKSKQIKQTKQIKKTKTKSKKPIKIHKKTKNKNKKTHKFKPNFPFSSVKRKLFGK